MSFWGFQPYVSVAERRARAAKEVEKLRKKGTSVAPVVVDGAKIAKSFWGRAWCDNLERYSDYANRLGRGRSYVKHGAVIDLRVSRGKVEALVAGSSTYKVKIDVAVAATARWGAICADCAGSIGSLVELLQGKFSKHVMERVCRETDGLFPTPKEIKMSCSCPDWAGMCKHVAATLYGVGARLDHDPDVLFTLRGVDRGDLVSSAGDLSICDAGASSARVLAVDDMAALFGLEMEAPEARPATTARMESTPTGKRVAGLKSKVAAQKVVARTKRGVEQGAQSSLVKKADPQSEAPAETTVTRKRAALSKTSGRNSAPAPDRADAAQTKRGRRPAKPASEAAPAAGREKPARSASAKPTPTTISQSDRPPATRPDGDSTPPQSRTRAARWIGAKARKAARH